MADLADLENAFVNAISTMLINASYTLATSETPGMVRLYRGWPLDHHLKNDLLAGVTNITIFSAPGVARNVTRYLRNSTWANVAQAATPMTATLSGSVVTFAGTASTSEIIGIGVRYPIVGEKGYSLRLTSGLTPTQVAVAFAANIAGATSVGPALTLPAPHTNIVVTVGGDVTTLLEVHRNDQQVMVVIWSPTVAIRDQLSTLIDPQLIYINHLMFPEGSVSGPIRGDGTAVDDKIGKEFMWKRTLYYMVEYPTEYISILPVMTLGIDTVNDSLTMID